MDPRIISYRKAQAMKDIEAGLGCLFKAAGELHYQALDFQEHHDPAVWELKRLEAAAGAITRLAAG